jgi:integrase
VATNRPAGEPFKMADGRWGARYYDRTGKRRQVAAKTVTAVLVKRDEALTGRDTTETLGAFLDWWLDVHLERRRRRKGTPTAKTIDSYREQVGRVPERLRALRLVDVGVEDVETWIDELERTRSERTGELLSRRTVQYAHAVLRSAFEQAVRTERLDRNPVRLVQAPAPAKTTRTVLQPSQVAPFVAACRSDRLGSMWLVALAHGLRPGEAAAVPVGGVDVAAGTIAVRHNLTRSRGVWVHKTTKTHAEGVYTLPDFAAEAVARRLEERDLERAMAGPVWSEAQVRVGDPDGEEAVVPLLWCREDGQPLGTKGAAASLRRICAAAGVPQLTPHELRHSFASLLIASGVAPELVSKLMRHTRVATTTDIYSHLLDPVVEGATGHLDELARRPAGDMDGEAPRPSGEGSGG